MSPIKTSYTIPLNTTETTITIPILSDTANEGNETFNLTLSNLTGAVFAEGTSLTQAITIVDDELPVVKFTNLTASIAEDVTDGMVDLDVSLSGATTNPVTVTFATADGIGFFRCNCWYRLYSTHFKFQYPNHTCWSINGNYTNTHH